MPTPPLIQFLAEHSGRTGIIALLVLLSACTATTHTITEAPDAARSAHAPDLRDKKSVTINRFQVANSLQVEDISDIWNGYPLELLRRLEAGGRIAARYSTATLFPNPNNINPDSPASRELIRRIAEQNGSELVISGLILDAAVGDESLRPYFGWQGRETGRRFELGLPWNSVVAGVHPVATERRLEVEIFLHDGRTGELVKRYRNGSEISGRATVGRNIPFASAAFFDTDFGQATERLLNTQILLLGKDIASRQ